MFAGGLDFSLPVRKFFYDPLGSGKAFVNAVVSLTGFALVGGPARQDAPKVRAPNAPQLCLQCAVRISAFHLVTHICHLIRIPLMWTHIP